MNRVLALFLTGLMVLFAVSAVSAQTDAAEPSADVLNVGGVTPMTGNFFCSLWGNVTSDMDVRLLLHGSLYERLGMASEIYEDVEPFVAPEVFKGEPANDRSEVFALAKFIDYLYASSGLPIELKQVIKKATSDDPANRYATVAEFFKTVKQRRAAFRSALTGIGALAAALIIVGLFFTLTIIIGFLGTLRKHLIGDHLS